MYDTNAVDEATREVEQYVGTIKHNYELGGRYMTVGDLMDKIAAEAAAEAAAEVAAEKDVYFSKLLNEQDRKLEEKDKYIEEKERETQELKALLAQK